MKIDICVEEGKSIRLSVQGGIKHELERLGAFRGDGIFKENKMIVGTTSNDNMFFKAGIVQYILKEVAYWGTDSDGLYLSLMYGHTWEEVLQRLQSVESIEVKED